jgi:hypothetical protein
VSINQVIDAIAKAFRGIWHDLLLLGQAALDYPVNWSLVCWIALGVLAAFAVAKSPLFVLPLLKGWGRLVGAPVSAPIREWRSIRERRERGEVVGGVATASTLIWTFFFAVLLSTFALIPPLLTVLWAVNWAYNAWPVAEWVRSVQL